MAPIRIGIMAIDRILDEERDYTANHGDNVTNS